MQPPYSRYAAIYDRTGQHQFGAIMAERVLAWLGERGFPPMTALDLATGTGAAAMSFARHGIKTTGIDLSREMLDHARDKATDGGLLIDWLQGDMRTFSLDPPVDLAVCFFDSLNYLLEENDLRACFASVYNALRPGGWFIFDVNPIHRYATDWNESSDVAYSDEHLLCLFRSNFDADTHRSPLILTVFEREGDDSDLWRCWEEIHIERGYPLTVVVELLGAAGFDIAECRSLDEKQMVLAEPASETSMRAVFFARKPHTAHRK
jgi:ubiquinone/menaquinone biosynthesis C-methylase UbiE